MTEKTKPPLDIPYEIESVRLLIRRYEKGDGKYLLALLERNDNRDFLKEHVDEATEVLTLEDAEKRVKQLHDFWKKQEHFVMGIWFKETDTFIGNIWIQPDKWKNPSFNLGYYLDKGYTDKGLATEAAKRAVKFIFDDLKATKIRLFTRDTNERSYKLADRLGFVKEGHDRENIRHEGKMIGLFHYGMLRREYLENPDYTKDIEK